MGIHYKGCVGGIYGICGAYGGVSQNYGYPFWSPYNEHLCILGSILGSLNFGELLFDRGSMWDI